MVTRTPLAGDRSAYDVINHPDKHASDLETNSPVHHVPAGSSSGDLLQWDGTQWVATSVSSLGMVVPMMTIGTVEGEVQTGTSPFKIYNLYGTSRTLTKIFLSIAIAPTGADLVVDILINGSSIFPTSPKPKIIDGNISGYVTTIDTTTWASNNYIQFKVDSVGSTISGSNLVIHIVHE